MYDYHVHSDFSADGKAPMAKVAEAAILAGLSEIAITDHFDPDYPVPGWPSTLDFDAYHKEMGEVADYYKNRIKITKGIEIGIQHGETLKKCREAAKAYEYDFILGSFHCAEGFELSCGDFYENRSPEEATRAFYRYNLKCLKDFDDFDVLGHINVVDRYGSSIPEDASYMDELSAVLKLLIDKGKGIEVNTSSFRYDMGARTTPTKEILKRYKDLGGEIITIGSDAHSPEDVAYAFDWGYEMLKSIGFKYLTIYRNRFPEFINLL